MEDIATLVIKAQGGDAEAFRLLVERFQDMVFTVAYARIGNEVTAEDIAQETFIEVYLHLGSLREPRAFAGWLKRVTLHQCARVSRRISASLVSLDHAADLPHDEVDPMERVIGAEERSVLRKVIESLPEDQRTATLLHYISGYSQKEIADFLEIPVDRVRKRLQIARNRLREMITRMSEDYFEKQPSRNEAFTRRIRFFVAVQTGDMGTVKALLREDPRLIGTRQQFSETMTQSLPSRGQPDQELLKMGDELGREGWTPLAWSVAQGHLQLAELLLEKGASASEVNDGQSVLFLAAQEGYEGLVEMLLRKGANPNNPECDRNRSPLHVAVGLGWESIVGHLLTGGADTERQDHVGRTPLFWGATSGNRVIVYLLLKHGADVDVVDRNGWKAEDWAERNGHLEIKEMLQEWRSKGSFLLNESLPSDNDEFAGNVLDATAQSTPLLDRIAAISPQIGLPGEEMKRRVEHPKKEMLRTGIKGIDLLTPLPREGSVLLQTPWGIGGEVFLQELIRGVEYSYGGRGVLLFLPEIGKGMSFAHKLELEKAHYRILGLLQGITAILIPKEASTEVRQYALGKVLGLVRMVLEEGCPQVLVGLDRFLVGQSTLEQIESLTEGVNGKVLTVISGYEQDDSDTSEEVLSIQTDVYLALAPGKPALDLLASTVNSDCQVYVDETHRQLAADVRKVLNAKAELLPHDNGSVEILERYEDGSRIMIQRARLLERYLSQPLFGLQLITGVPAESVPLERTMEVCKRIVEGVFDGVSSEEEFHDLVAEQRKMRPENV